MQDRYEARLREVIDAKVAGEEIQAPDERRRTSPATWWIS